MNQDKKSTIFDLEFLKKELKKEVPEYDEMNDQWFVQIYLGSVMNILPSGKYYMPFACSNVEICNTCTNAGSVPCTEQDPCKYPNDDSSDIQEDYHCEACQDARWHKQAEEELDSIGAFLVSGEGNPTDLFVQKKVDTPDEINDE